MSILSESDLNSILFSLRKTKSNVFGNCSEIFNDKVNEAYILSGKVISKNSASLTDIILAQAQTSADNKFFNVALKIWFGWNELKQDQIEKGFQKIEAQAAGNVNVLDIFIGPIKNADKLPPAKLKEAMEKRGKKYLDIKLRSADPIWSTSLDYEARMYQYITENIVMKNISPNFIPMLSASECGLDDIIASLQANHDRVKNIEALIMKLQLLQSAFPTLKLKFMLNGSSSTIFSLEDALTSHHDDNKNLQPPKISDENELCCVITQCLYGLYVMNKFQIRQGDLHFGNILVEELTTPVMLNININGNFLKMNTKYIVKFFDMDRGYNENLGINDVVDDMPQTGTINRFKSNRDYTQFLCSLLTSEITWTKKHLQMLLYLGILKSKEETKMFDHITADESKTYKLENMSFNNIEKYVKDNKALIYSSQFDNKYFIEITVQNLVGLVTAKEFSDMIQFLTAGNKEYSDRLLKIDLEITKLRKEQSIQLYKGWYCQLPQDFNFNINSLFETDAIHRFNMFLLSHNIGNPILNYKFLSPGNLPTIYVPKPNIKDMQFSGLAIDPTAVPFLTYNPGMVPLKPINASTYLDKNAKMAPTMPVIIAGTVTAPAKAATPVPSTNDMLKGYIYRLFKNVLATASYIDVQTFLLSIEDRLFKTVIFIYRFLEKCVSEVSSILKAIYYLIISLVNVILQVFVMTIESIGMVMKFCVNTLRVISEKVSIGSKFMFKMFKDFATMFSDYISAFSLARMYNQLVIKQPSYQVSQITAQSMDQNIVREKRRIDSVESEGQMSPRKYLQTTPESAFFDYDM
uniref:Uncharacterized protein n=1 Tax=viral metagenome TaxID=1070528 RepID=A0A6C0KR51_9ZZZZ